MLGFKKRKEVSMKQLILNLTDNYFSAFNRKKLDLLELMYADDVILDEFGKNVYTGKQEVLRVNEEMFIGNPDLWIAVTNTAVNNFSTFSSIVVNLQKDSKVEVVDVIYFELNPPHKIFKIVAYGGKGIVV